MAVIVQNSRNLRDGTIVTDSYFSSVIGFVMPKSEK